MINLEDKNMKNSFSIVIALLALAVGCDKTVLTEQTTSQEESKPVVKTRIFAKVNEPETKSIVEVNGMTGKYVWEDSETISVYDGTSLLTFTEENKDLGIFSTLETPSGDLLYSVSPADAVSSPTSSTYTLTLKEEYTGYTSNTSNAIMVAGLPSDRGADKVFTFQHVAGLMRFTYENIPVGTTALRFSTSDKKINGAFSVAGTSVELLQTEATGTTSTKLTLPSAVSSPNTSMVFYVPVPTGDYTDFSVALLNGGDVVDGTSKTMTRNFTVSKGSIVNTPVITLNRVGSSDYVKITSSGDLEDGDYLIVYESGKVALDGSLDAIDAQGNYVDVTISDSKITATDSMNSIAFTYNSSDKTLRSKSGYYIGRTATSNGMNTSESTKYENTITFSSGNAVITSSGGPILQFYSTSGQERFRYYASTQKSIALYKKVTTPSGVQLSVPQNLGVDAANKRVSWRAVSGAASYTVTVNGNKTTGVTETYKDFVIEDGFYDVTVVACSGSASPLDSYAATLNAAKFGDPTLDPPAGFTTGTITNSSIVLNWEAVTNATKYYCSISPADAEPQYVFSNSVTFTGLTKDETYTISVIAIDETGKYSSSSVSTADPIDATAPTGLVLPYNYNDNASNLSSSYITKNGVGDYGTTNAKIKFDNEGDYLIFQVSQAVSSFSINTVQNGATNGSVLTLSGSVNGVSYTTIATFTISQGQNKSATKSSSSIDSSYRYIKLEMTTRKVNVGVGQISIN